MMAGGLWSLSRRVKAPHVLVIDDFVPGTRAPARMPRAAELLRALAATGARITVLPTRGEFVEEPPGLATLRIGDGDALGHVLSARIGTFAAIIVSRPGNMAMLADVVARTRAVIGDAMIVYDAEMLYAGQELRACDRRGTPLSGEDADRLITAEVSHCLVADVVLAIDAATAETFRAARHPDVRVLGYAVTPQPTPQPFGRRSGFLTATPTYGDDTAMAEGMIWFADQVLPTLRAGLGRSAALTVVAQNASWLNETQADRRAVSMRAFADFDAAFEKARVYVAPLHAAIGLPLNIYDAAARGVPAVVTPALARQLGWVHGREILVAQSREEFVAACISLYRDQLLWEGLRANALVRVAQDCGRSRFDAIIRDLVARAAAAPPD